MDFNDISEIKKSGFEGFIKIQELWNDSSIIPKVRGVYLVWNPYPDKADFLSKGSGGYFKGKDPNVTGDVLNEKFISGVNIVYIGKAGSPTNKATLNSRLKQYLRFGQKRNVGHWGGRYIWQLEYSSSLLIAWKSTPNQNPRDVEVELLTAFQRQFKAMPFANLR